MSFWGVEIKPDYPITIPRSQTGKRVRITQATLGYGETLEKSVLQCRVGMRSLVFLCALLPNNVESFNCYLEFEVADDVVFNVVGRRSIHLAGYYVHTDTIHAAMDIENNELSKSNQRNEGDRFEDVEDTESNKLNQNNEDDKNGLTDLLADEHQQEDVNQMKLVSDGLIIEDTASGKKVNNESEKFNQNNENDQYEDVEDSELEKSNQNNEEDNQQEKPSSKEKKKKKKNNQQEDLNESKLEINTLSNGLIIEVLAKGDPDGKTAASRKKVKVHFTGMLKENGLVIESTVDKRPCKVLLGMRVGDKRRLTIPPSMGFGEEGFGEIIPPNAWLLYEVELLGVRR